MKMKSQFQQEKQALINQKRFLEREYQRLKEDREGFEA